MYINNIIINNFKSIDLINIKTEKINIIYGKNASGKSNIIEGIFTILNGHSTTKKLLHLQNNVSKKTILTANVNNQNILIEIFKNRKNIFINNKRVNTIFVKKNFFSLIFSIESFISFDSKNYLFSLIDKNTFIENKKIVDMLIEYKKLLKLKKNLIITGKNDGFLNLTHKKILELIDIISKERINSLKILEDNINNLIKKFTDKSITLEYIPYKFDYHILDYELVNKRLLTTLNKDKINILLDNNNIFTFSSVGEKKIVLLNLIVSIIYRYNKYIKPILLIDDLEGDLDIDSKQIAKDLLFQLPNQLFLTTLGEYLYNRANIIRL